MYIIHLNDCSILDERKVGKIVKKAEINNGHFH